MSDFFRAKEVSRIGQESPSQAFHGSTISPEQNKLFAVTREANRPNIPSGFPAFKSLEPLSPSKKDISPAAKAPIEAKETGGIKEKKEPKEAKKEEGSEKEKTGQKEKGGEKEKGKRKEHKGGGGKKLHEGPRGGEPSEKEPKDKDNKDHEKREKEDERLDKKKGKEPPESCAADAHSSLKLVPGIPGLTAPAIGDSYVQTKCGADGKPVVSSFDLSQKMTGKQWTEADGRKISETYAGDGHAKAPPNNSTSKSPMPSQIDEQEAQKGRILTSRHEVFPNGDFDYSTYDKNGRVTGGVTYFNEQLKSK